jgi:hypothetical protein
MTLTTDGLSVPDGARGVTTPGEGAAAGRENPNAGPAVTEDGFFLRSRAGAPQRAAVPAPGRLDEVTAPEPETAPEAPAGIQIPRSALPLSPAPEAVTAAS